jgi:hypothetical protein
MIAGSLAALAVVGGAVMMQRGNDDPPAVEVVFGTSDGLPTELYQFAPYKAVFVIDWSGGSVAMRDGVVSVFASRQGDTTEDAPEDGWPLVCESEFDDVVEKSRLICPFVAPGPGEFALLLEVHSVFADETIGEGLYTHLVIDPDATSED